MAISYGRKWLLGGSLIRYAILSFVVIGAVTAALSFVISQVLQHDMLQREWYVTGNYIRLEAQQDLRPSDFAHPGSGEAAARFRAFYEQVLRMPEIARVKIYDRTMTVVWSDEPRLIGQRFADNPQLVEALGGQTVASVVDRDQRKAENLFEHSPYLVELYVPLEMASAPGVTGIAEIYKTPAEVFGNIERARRMVVGTAVLGGALLWASLFGIVRGAARGIERQHSALEQRSRELAAANEELRNVQTQLVAAGRMAAIGEVVAAVAHGIRNPLANIRASAQVALLDCGSCSSTHAASNLAHVISEVDRLGSRVSELLHFVRPTERRPAPLDLNAVLRQSLDATTGRLTGGKVDIVEDLAPRLPVIVGDGALLEQAFGGLMENAVDAMTDGPGTLTIVTGTEALPSGAVQVFAEVRDTGPGIPPQHLGRIFELFYTTKPRGTGLGLSLAKKFIEAYDGALTVRGRPGEGTAFRATFPAAA